LQSIELAVAAEKLGADGAYFRVDHFARQQHALSGDTISLTGQIQAKDPISLAFRIGGRLQERSVTVGDPVAPGQVVARIEPQDLQNALHSAEADLASARAVLANSKGTEGRQSELLSKGFTTQAQYNQAEAQMKTAQAQVESAQARLQNAKDNLACTDLKSDVAGSVTAKGAYHAAIRGGRQTNADTRNHSLAEAHQQHWYSIWYCS
jgi:RND family efflux transporter MFP subunit